MGTLQAVGMIFKSLPLAPHDNASNIISADVAVISIGISRCYSYDVIDVRKIRFEYEKD